MVAWLDDQDFLQWLLCFRLINNVNYILSTVWEICFNILIIIVYVYLFERCCDEHDVHGVAEIVRAKKSGVDKLSGTKKISL